MHWVLLTGGIGSGKTTVSKQFNKLGVPVIDTDEIAHQLTQENAKAIPKIRAVFGESAIDSKQALNRSWMRELIFSDATAKEKLEQILHPMIFAEVLRLQQQYQAVYGLIVVPVFSATSCYNQIIARILVVDSDEGLQLSRVMQRNKLTRQQVLQMIQAQLSREQRNQLADDILYNDFDFSHVEAQVEKLHLYYLKLFQEN